MPSSFTRNLASPGIWDIFIKPDAANAQAVFAALADFGAPLQGIQPEDFADRGSFFRFGHDPRGFDLLPSIPGVDFDEAWKRRVEAVMDERTGLKANFISADDLVAAKLAAGRPQDLADAEAIQKAQGLRPAETRETMSSDDG